VVELSWYGDRVTPLALGRGFHVQRLSLRSSQVGALPPAQAARWTHARRLAMALSLLRDPSLDGLLGAPCHFEQLPRRLASLLQVEARGDAHEQNGDAPCPLVQYDVP
jgi:hypothetical protein